MTKLSVEGVTKKFDNVTAVDDLSLNVAEGEAAVFLGPSGCGKTTLLKLIAGFLAPNTGRILLDGEVLSTPRDVLAPNKRSMGMVFQSYAIWPHKTVFENVSFGLRIRKEPKDVIARKTKEALAMVKMDGLEDRYATELSGGQQQRVALARALVVEPSVLLLDEPLSNLDAGLRDEMREEIRDLKMKLGITFVYVTHDQIEAMIVGDRVILMNHGQIVQESAPRELYNRPHSRFAANFIGKANVVAVKIPSGGSEPRVSASFGEILLAERPPAGDDQALLVSIRPERIQLMASSDPAQPNVYPGEIVRQQFHGKCIAYEIRIGETELSVEVAVEQDLPEGSRVFVHLPPDACIAVADDEKTIREK